MARAQIALIIPLGDAPGYIPGLHPDQGLPGGEYYPDQGLPGGGRPPHVSNRPPGSWNPEHPSTGPVRPGRPVDPGFGWGGEYPSTGPIVPPMGGTDVPPDEYQPLPPPEDIYSQYVVSVWDPKTASWTTKAYPPR
jgi:hypothetical protein